MHQDWIITMGNNVHFSLDPAFTDLRKFYHAIILSEEGNFARASARLCITQSALTRSIQSLESIFDVRLFDRSHTKVTTTAVGIAILDKARSLLLHVGTLVNEVALLRNAEIGNLSFGVGLNPSSIFLPEALVKIYKKYPHLSVNVEQKNSDELKNLLLTEKIEFYFSHKQLEETTNSNLTEDQLIKIPIHFLCRREHPLLKKKTVSSRDLKLFPIARTQNSESSHNLLTSIVGEMKELSEENHGGLIINDIQCLESLALNTDVIMICSKKAVESSLNDGLLKIINVSDSPAEMSLSCSIVKIKGRTLSPAAEIIIGSIKNLIDF